ncbi:Uncharacterised protein [Candidatus Bilamarchaeum dharawalense]|uniref:CARDB domain-containing protein n=1 Tax=Candidatus Bilamarchaeum dharawalense TaxID=2885759 RepID=A0A5E4LQ99_9ARCH|nr:Uncharacterised protein [Candidatus Bilamarchaeum dharawalense]
MKKLMVAFMLLFALSFAGISITDYTVSKDSFQPNEQGVLTTTIVNPTGSARVTALTMSIDNPYEIIISGSTKLSDIEAGGTGIVSIPIKIRPEAKAGVYLVTVIFSGTSYENGVVPNTVTNSVSIPVTVLNQPILSFATDTSSLSGIDTVHVTITNNGGLAKNARLSTSGTISLYGTNEVFLGNLEGSKNITLQLDSRSATNGPEDLVFVMNYEDELGTKHSNDYTIRMTVKKAIVDVTFLQNSDLITRKEGPVKLAIKNNGAKLLKDVRLTFSNTSLRFKDRAELSFGDIAPGATSEVNPTIFADLTPGLNLIDGTLSWVEEDVTKDEAVDFPLTVSSDADVGIYLEAKPTPLIAGQEHTISVLVSNLGSYPIDNVDVHFSSDSFKSLDISDGQYIGNLNNDDFSTVQFKVRVGDVPEGEYQVNIDVSYRDRSGEWKHKIVPQTVNVYSAPVKSGGEMFILGGIVVVALVAWFFFIRKKPAKVG